MTNQLHIGINDRKIANKVKEYCKRNDLRYSEFAIMAFKDFFKNPRNELRTKTKDELIDMIEKLLEGGKQCSCKN